MEGTGQNFYTQHEQCLFLLLNEGNFFCFLGQEMYTEQVMKVPRSLRQRSKSCTHPQGYRQKYMPPSTPQSHAHTVPSEVARPACYLSFGRQRDCSTWSLTQQNPEMPEAQGSVCMQPLVGSEPFSGT